MRASNALLLLPMLVVALVASGCQTQTSVVDGSGFKAITMLPATRNYIVNNDLDLANQIVAHNETCMKQPGCRK